MHDVKLFVRTVRRFSGPSGLTMSAEQNLVAQMVYARNYSAAVAASNSCPLEPRLDPRHLTALRSRHGPVVDSFVRDIDLPGFFGPMISRKIAPDPRGAHEKESIH